MGCRCRPGTRGDRCRPGAGVGDRVWAVYLAGDASLWQGYPSGWPATHQPESGSFQSAVAVAPAAACKFSADFPLVGLELAAYGPREGASRELGKSRGGQHARKISDGGQVSGEEVTHSAGDTGTDQGATGLWAPRIKEENPAYENQRDCRE